MNSKKKKKKNLKKYLKVLKESMLDDIDKGNEVVFNFKRVGQERNFDSKTVHYEYRFDIKRVEPFTEMDKLEGFINQRPNYEN